MPEFPKASRSKHQSDIDAGFGVVFAPASRFPSECSQAERGGDRGESGSLSLSHNSDGTPAGDSPYLPFKLTGSQAKTAFALRENAEVMIREDGLECCGFTTFTVGDWVDGQFLKIYDVNEASRRWNNLNRHVIKGLFERCIVVSQRHADGGIHFHALGTLEGRPDIRTGFDHAEVNAGRYGSVSVELLAIWAMLREVLPMYGFGRAEMKPVEKTGEAVASYVARYIEKNICDRRKEDIGKKLVRYCGWNRHLKANDFGWQTKRATAWRKKAEELASLAGVDAGQAGRDEVAEVFGGRWAFRLSCIMRAVDDSPLPAFEWSSPHERECARQFVLRVANSRWVLRRCIRNSASPVEWCPDWEAVNEARYQRVAPVFNI